MYHPFRLQPRWNALWLAATTAVGLTLSAPAPAFSMDAVAFFRAMQAEVEKDGNVMTFESLDAVGGEGARATGIKIIDEAKGETVTIGEMTLNGTRVLGDDAFSFETMEARDFGYRKLSDNGNVATISIAHVSATEFELPDDGVRGEADTNPFWPLNLASGELENIRISGSGDDEAGVSMNIPSLSLSDLRQKGGVSFDLGSLEISASGGSFTGDNGASGEFSLGGISLRDAGRIGQSGFRFGSVEIGRLEMDGVDARQRDIALTFEGMSATNQYSPDFSSEKPVSYPVEPMLATLGRLSVMMAGKEVFALAGGESYALYEADKNRIDSWADITGLAFDITALPDEPSNANAKAQMKALGYDRVQMDMRLEGAWEIADGLLDLSKWAFDFKDMGTLDVSFRLGGYTEEFARKLQEISNRMNQVTDRDVQQALSMQLLAEMSGLTVESMTIRVDDNSLTRRVMEMQAKQSGQTAEEMASALPFMAGMMLSQLDIPDFAATVSTAVGAYLTSSLDDRGSIAIIANPDEPVSFAEIMGIAAGARAGNVEAQEIIDRLNLSVEGR